MTGVQTCALPISLSGPGSSLAYTENLRIELPKLIEQFGIKTVLDAPCGDMHWMEEVLAEYPDLNYIGGDIVDSLVEQHKVTFSSRANTEFLSLDIIRDTLPAADLMICRDCLFHLSEADIKTFLKNFVNSDIHALLTTSHAIGYTERDIESGSYRSLNLFLPPYNFTADYIYSIEDWIKPHPERWMFMWSRDQIAEIVSKF